MLTMGHADPREDVLDPPEMRPHRRPCRRRIAGPHRRKDVPVLLASTAAMEAKIAGSNAFQLRLIRANKGTISAFSTKIFGRTFAAAGITEARAKAEGFSINIGEFTTMDRHPGSLPGMQKINMKLMVLMISFFVIILLKTLINKLCGAVTRAVLSQQNHIE